MELHQIALWDYQRCSLDSFPLLIIVRVSGPILNAVAEGDKSNVQHSGPAKEQLNKHSVTGPQESRWHRGELQVGQDALLSPPEHRSAIRLFVRALNVKFGVTFSARPSSQQREPARKSRRGRASAHCDESGPQNNFSASFIRARSQWFVSPWHSSTQYSFVYTGSVTRKLWVQSKK